MKVAKRSGSRSGQATTVVFVDDYAWRCFFQLAAGVRRAGFRAVRVTTESPGRAASLCFNHTVQLASSADLVHLPSILEDETVADLQVVESLAAETYRSLGELPSSGGAQDWTNRRSAVDKLVVSDRLRARGLLAPRVVTTPVEGPDQIVETLGLPVLCKVRIGSGGDGVWVIRTREELEHRLSLGCNRGSHFFEEYVPGRALQYGAVFNEGQVELDVTYETVSRTNDMGPALEVLCFEDRDLESTGRRVAECLGVNGMINVDVIRDAEGRDWVHDVNPRVWGSFALFRPARIDLLGAYVRWLRGTTPSAPRVRNRIETRLEVFPPEVERTLRGWNRARTHVRFCRRAVPYLRWIGPRYVAYESLLHIRKTQRQPE